MAQVNKYTDKTAYEADTARSRTQSAVSLVETDYAIIYDGINILVEKSAAAIGDLAVYDKTGGGIKFIKGATLLPAQLPVNLIPLAVVYARQGEKVLIVSLDNATYNGSASIRWAAPYEVALSGFNLTAGGSFTIRINITDYTFTYAAGATLTDVAANIAANLPNYNNINYGGWTASALGDEIIMTSNTYSVVYATIDAVSGCAIRRTPDDKNYQTTLTGLLIGGLIEYMHRDNRANVSYGGCNMKRGVEYYSTRGGLSTNVKPGSIDIIRESVFTSESNPALVALYPTYKEYLIGELKLQHPSAFGAMLQDGKTNTGLIGSLRFIDIRGNPVACYPATAAALDYGISVVGATTGLEAGAWWAPSVNELYMLMEYRALRVIDAESDPVNCTLLRLNKIPIYVSEYSPHTSCEYNAYSMFIIYPLSGEIGGDRKCYPYPTRPVSSL